MVTMLRNRVMAVGWPAFIMAGVLEVLVFALIDPQDLHWQGHPLALSRQAIYTISFFAFWAVTAASSALTSVLCMSSEEINS